MYRTILNLIFILVTLSGQAQNFVWNKVYGANNNDYALDICHAGSRRYIYATGYITGSTSGTAVNFGSISLSSTKQAFTFILKMDTSGQVIWARKIFDGRAITSRILSDTNDNIYISAGLNRDSARVYPNTLLMDATKSGSNVGFLVKLNASGNYCWQRFLWTNSASYAGINKFIIAQDKILLSLNLGKGQFTIDADTASNSEQAWVLLDTNNQFYYMKPTARIVNQNRKYSPQNGRCLIWDFTIQGDSIHAVAAVVDSIFFGQKLYIFPNTGQRNEVANVRLSYALNSGSLGKVEQITPLLKNSISFSSIQYFSNTMHCLSGFFTDTLDLKGFDRIISAGRKSGSGQFFFAYYQNNKPYKLITFDLKHKWDGGIYTSRINSGFIYSSGWIFGNAEFDGFRIDSLKSSGFFMKMDSIGNVLWLVNNIQNPPVNFAFDEARAVYFGTNFFQKMQLTNMTFSSNGGYDFLISKIYDFTITRGQVSEGPYCAGDTFLIPYIKDGRFDSGNVFIAELSDENGDFTGKHRELGRLQSFKDSAIRGVLPLFDVVSSPNYRIRIMSTKPQVQSFYKLDGLRLLIYSKDTANAGDDTTVCHGSKLQLKTSGGTRWRWSPGHLVEDSFARTTLSKPIIQPIRFRIIISDSSGCGKTDTAYKWAYPAQSLAMLNKDTTVCRGSATIPARGNGGLPARYPYQFEWLDSKHTLISTSSVLSYTDAIPSQLLVVIKDGCSVGTDTASINVKRYDSLKVALPHTINICAGQPAVIKAKANGGLGKYYFTWYNANGTINSSTDSIIIKQYGTFNFGLKADDHCSLPGDSTSIRILSHVPLSFALPNDSILCYGTSTTIVPKIQNGAKNGPYQFIRNFNAVKDTVTSEVYTGRYVYPGWVKVNARDCNDIITDSLYYSVLPKLDIHGAGDTSLCDGQIFRLKIFATGGKDPLIKWMNAGGKMIQTAKAIDTLFTPAPASFRLVAFDNCTVPNDTATMKLSVRQPLKATLSSNPACYKDTVNLKAALKGGKANQYQFLWKNNSLVIGTDTSIKYTTRNQIQKVYFVLSDNCSAPFTDSLELNPMAIARIYVDNHVQCLDNNKFLVANQTDSTRKNITFKDLDLGTNTDVTRISLNSYMVRFKDTGTFKFKVTAGSNAGTCRDSAIETVQVKPVPKLDINWIRTTLTYDHSNWLFSAQANQPVKMYSWYIDQFPVQYGKSVEQGFSYTGKIKIRVVAEGNTGCAEDTTVFFDLLHRLRFYVPDAITVNSDGINDNFFIPGSQYMKEFQLQIFNRWGECVFKSSNPTEKWSPLDESNNVYVYLVNILDVYNERHKLSGTFHVLR